VVQAGADGPVVNTGEDHGPAAFHIHCGGNVGIAAVRGRAIAPKRLLERTRIGHPRAGALASVGTRGVVTAVLTDPRFGGRYEDDGVCGKGGERGEPVR
jgi:hypothetical protein